MHGFVERLNSDLHKMAPPGSIIKIVAMPSLYFVIVGRGSIVLCIDETYFLFLFIFIFIFFLFFPQNVKSNFGKEPLSLLLNQG